MDGSTSAGHKSVLTPAKLTFWTTSAVPPPNHQLSSIVRCAPHEAVEDPEGPFAVASRKFEAVYRISALPSGACEGVAGGAKWAVEERKPVA